MSFETLKELVLSSPISDIFYSDDLIYELLHIVENTDSVVDIQDAIITISGDYGEYMDSVADELAHHIMKAK